MTIVFPTIAPRGLDALDCVAVLARRTSDDSTWYCAGFVVVVGLLVWIGSVVRDRSVAHARVLEIESHVGYLKQEVVKARGAASDEKLVLQKRLSDQLQAASARESELQLQLQASVERLTRADAEHEAELEDLEDEVDARLERAKEVHATWVREVEVLSARLVALSNAFGESYISGRKWLLDAYREHLDWHDRQHKTALTLTARPNTAIADELEEVKAQRRELAVRVKALEWQLASYEEYFPELMEYRDAILSEAVDLRRSGRSAISDMDPALARGYLTKKEFETLDRVAKFQLALQRYVERRKQPWEIGRDYERQIGYQYERSGWRVHYQGALQGLEDLGQDLVCSQPGKLIVVQCKCWRESREIRERHVLQLFGTTTLRALENGLSQDQVTAVLVTTGKLSDVASRIATRLGVRVDKVPRAAYPLIKCNVSSESGEKIYHLPFDQQYDRVVIGDQPGECYVETVAEAERRGFRRAMRWQGEQ